MKKRIVSLLLALVLCLSLCPSALAAGSFTDVSSGAWYYKDVTRVVELGLMQGRTGGRFAPNDLMTEAEAVTLAARLYEKVVDGAPAIPERKAGEPWYAPYANYLSKLDPVKFGPLDAPNEPATRMSYVNLFYAVLPETFLTPVNDVPDGSIPDVPAAKEGAEAVYSFYRDGILRGSDAHGYFNADSYIKRCEVAAILVRIMDEDARVKFTLGVGYEGVANVCAANGAVCAVAYLGYTDGGATESLLANDFRIDLYRRIMPFLDEAALVEQPGDEVYLVVPAAPGSYLAVTGWSYDDDHIDGTPGEPLGYGEPGQAMIVRGNISDIMPNLRVFVMDSNKEALLEFSPSLSLKDGKLEQREGVYDYTLYGEG